MSDDLSGLPGEPQAPPPSLDAQDFNLKGGGSKKPLLIVIAAVVLGGGGFAVYRMVDKQNTEKMHAAFMESFQSVDKEEMSKFWTCLLGKDMDPGLFADNLAFTKKIDTSFATDPLHYPDSVVDQCVPILDGVAKHAGALTAPPDYEEALGKYKKSVGVFGDSLKSWAEVAKTRAASKIATNAVLADNAAFHAVAGTPSAEAIAYDKFLRCAIPEADKLKDTQALLELLADKCFKHPAADFINKALTDCGKLATPGDTKVDAKFKATLKKYGADDRDGAALHDCFSRAQKAAKDEGLDPVGRAFFGYNEASRAVKQVGAEKLKAE